MASQQDLINILVSQGRLPRASVERTAVFLRRAGMLQVGGRGPYAPVVTGLDGVNLLIGAIGAKTTPGAVRAVQTLSGLEIDPGDSKRLRLGSLKKLDDMVFFGEFLSVILHDIKYAEQVSEIILNQTYPEAQIIFFMEDTHSFKDQFGIWFHRVKGPNGILGVENKAHIPGCIVDAIARLIKDKEQS